MASGNTPQCCCYCHTTTSNPTSNPDPCSLCSRDSSGRSCHSCSMTCHRTDSCVRCGHSCCNCNKKHSCRGRSSPGSYGPDGRSGCSCSNTNRPGTGCSRARYGHCRCTGSTGPDPPCSHGQSGPSGCTCSTSPAGQSHDGHAVHRLHGHRRHQRSGNLWRSDRDGHT